MYHHWRVKNFTQRLHNCSVKFLHENVANVYYGKRIQIIITLISSIVFKFQSGMSDKLKKIPFLKEIMRDISSRSAYIQMFFGASSGWLVGLSVMKIGKIAALTLGGSIILLEIAHQEGIIRIDCLKAVRSLQKVTYKVEEAVIGEEKKWKNKAESYVDRKLDHAENVLKAKSKNVKKWYNNLFYDDMGLKLKNLHIFAIAFVGGVALGIASA